MRNKEHLQFSMNLFGLSHWIPCSNLHFGSYKIVLWKKVFTKTDILQICALSSSCLTTSTSSVSHDSRKTATPLIFPFSSIMFSHFYFHGHLSCILTSFCFPVSSCSAEFPDVQTPFCAFSAQQPENKVCAVVCPTVAVLSGQPGSACQPGCCQRKWVVT